MQHSEKLGFGQSTAMPSPMQTSHWVSIHLIVPVMFLTVILYMLTLGLIINHGLMTTQFLQMKMTMTMRRMTMMNKGDKLIKPQHHHSHQFTNSHHQLSLYHYMLLLLLTWMAPFYQLISTPKFLNLSAMAAMQKLMFLCLRTKLLHCTGRMKNLQHMQPWHAWIQTHNGLTWKKDWHSVKSKRLRREQKWSGNKQEQMNGRLWRMCSNGSTSKWTLIRCSLVCWTAERRLTCKILHIVWGQISRAKWRKSSQGSMNVSILMKTYAPVLIILASFHSFHDKTIKCFLWLLLCNSQPPLIPLNCIYWCLHWVLLVHQTGHICSQWHWVTSLIIHPIIMLILILQYIGLDSYCHIAVNPLHCTIMHLQYHRYQAEKIIITEELRLNSACQEPWLMWLKLFKSLFFWYTLKPASCCQLHSCLYSCFYYMKV